MNKQKTNEEVQEEQKAQENEQVQDENAQADGQENPEVEEMDEQAKLREEVLHWKDKFMRLHAEFDNYRKRTIKERAELVKSASSDVMRELLPVLDDLDRAIDANKNNEDIEVLKEGFNLILHKLMVALEKKGLKPMESKGKDFDTDLHEAITQLPGDEDMKNKVVDVVEKGYYLNDHILRFAKVVVGS